MAYPRNKKRAGHSAVAYFDNIFILGGENETSSTLNTVIDIRRETLSTEEILLRSVNEIVSSVESKETGRNATNESAYVAAKSSFQRKQKERRIENGQDELLVRHAQRHLLSFEGDRVDGI